MRPRVLMDTGPLVALVTDLDPYHKLATHTLSQLDVSLVTCWPVLTEAAWMAQQASGDPESVFILCERDRVELAELTAQDLPPIRRLLSKYRDLRLQLADACLLHLADRLMIDYVLTFDRRDFGTARTPAGRSLAILPKT